ncbi:hypothetical protein HG530_001105 [Fusarium avenaceum]|nr:hypothetical protein HG530_001105 [Fusarium avenaceum]
MSRVMVSLVQLTDEASFIPVSTYDVDAIDVRWALPKQLNSWKQPGRATENPDTQALSTSWCSSELLKASRSGISDNETIFVFLTNFQIKSDNHGVDDRWDGRDTGCGCCNDERTLACSARLIIESLIITPDQHTNDENGQDVEDEDTDEDVLASLGNCTLGVSRLSSCHGDGLYTSEGEDSARHDRPVAQELAPASSRNVLDKRTWVLPVDDQTQDDEEDDEKDLENGEPNDEDDDPYRRVEIGPEFEQYTDCCDFRGNGEDVSVDEIPPDGEPPSRINQKLSMSHKRSCNWHQRSDFSQRELNRAHDDLHRLAQTEKETGSNSACDTQHRKMSLVQTALQVLLLSGRDEAAAIVVVALPWFRLNVRRSLSSRKNVGAHLDASDIEGWRYRVLKKTW